MMSDILYSIAWICLLINTLYWWWLQRAINQISTRISSSQNDVDSTLLIVHHNDHHHIKAHLTKWVAQRHSSLKIYIADDGSDVTIDSKGLDLFDTPNVSYHYFNKKTKGKKGTLESALNELESEVILLTDADCHPSSDLWARKIGQLLTRNKSDIFIGYAPLSAPESNWLTRLIRYESILTALQYLGWAKYGHPYMVVGRNVAYKKSVLSKGNWKNGSHLAGGDDDLFFQTIDAPKFVLSLDPETFTYSNTKNTWSSWLHQKSRHASTSFAYPKKVKWTLMIMAFTQIIWWMIILGPWWLWTPAIILRYVLLHPSAKKAFKKLQALDLYWFRPILDFLMVGYYLALGFKMIFRKKDDW